MSGGNVSEATAVQRLGGGMFVADVLLIELPHLTPDEREMVMWEFTGWPSFFMETPTEHWITVFRGQLALWRDHPAESYALSIYAAVPSPLPSCDPEAA